MVIIIIIPYEFTPIEIIRNYLFYYKYPHNTSSVKFPIYDFKYFSTVYFLGFYYNI